LARRSFESVGVTLSWNIDGKRRVIWLSTLLTLFAATLAERVDTLQCVLGDHLRWFLLHCE
jgi:hypothetical protein